MHKSWSSFRILLLLYIIVLVSPVGFYFVYQSFQTIQDDTKTARLSSWTSGSIALIAINPSEQKNTQTIKEVSHALEEISQWVMQNNHSEFYIGAVTLWEDFDKIQTCWNTYIQKLSEKNESILKQHASLCYDSSENLAIIIEKMVYLKQNKLINMFYFSLVVIMLCILLVVYLIRIYIHRQMKKHTIHDHETKLFNKKYFCAELETSCSRAQRNNSPLSILNISINDFEKKNKIYDKKTRESILNTLGELITSLTRTSDVASRYDENHFYILLPDTPEENAIILENRVSEKLENYDFGVTPELRFKFATAHLNDKESSEAFLKRTEKLLT